jgi:hypothetical protein
MDRALSFRRKAILGARGLALRLIEQQNQMEPAIIDFQAIAAIVQAVAAIILLRVTISMSKPFDNESSSKATAG